MPSLTRELRAWRDYLPAVFWGAAILAAAAAAPICLRLLLQNS